MFCIHCGKEIPDDAKFCKFCGQACVSSSGNEPKQQQTEPDTARSMPNKPNIPCPHCGAVNCQPITKTTAEAQSSNYSCLGGACGGLLLGPIGLLLGLCGGKSSSSVSTETKWICLNCGKEFFSLEGAKKEWLKLFNESMSFAALSIPFLSWGIIKLILHPGSLMLFLCVGGTFFSLAVGSYYTCTRKGYDCYSVKDLFPDDELAKLKEKWWVILTLEAFFFVICSFALMND